MYITCLDLEGVLVPEIWIAFSEATGIPELRRAIAENKPQTEVVKAADSTGYSKLKESCLELVVSGETTLSEMLRTVNVVE